MPFRDGYPDDIEFEFDRLAYFRFLQRSAWIMAIGIGTLVGFFFAAIGICHQVESHPMIVHEGTRWWWLPQVGIGLGSGILLGVVAWFLWSYGLKHYAQNARLAVEGPYLRIVDGGYWVTDRRIHFRDLSDYSLIDSPVLRSLGLKALSISICTNRPTDRRVTITGLLKPEQVRDMLCDIDAAREN